MDDRPPIGGLRILPHLRAVEANGSQNKTIVATPYGISPVYPWPPARYLLWMECVQSGVELRLEPTLKSTGRRNRFDTLTLREIKYYQWFKPHVGLLMDFRHRNLNLPLIKIIHEFVFRNINRSIGEDLIFQGTVKNHSKHKNPPQVRGGTAIVFVVRPMANKPFRQIMCRHIWIRFDPL